MSWKYELINTASREIKRYKKNGYIIDISRFHGDDKDFFLIKGDRLEYPRITLGDDGFRLELQNGFAYSQKDRQFVLDFINKAFDLLEELDIHFNNN